MKLCPHCREQLWQDAQMCRHCGRRLPTRAAAAGSRYWTLPRVVLAVLVIPTVLGMGLLVGLKVTGGHLAETLAPEAPARTAPAPAARYELAEVRVDLSCSKPAWEQHDGGSWSDACTNLLDYCIEVTCPIRAIGDEAAEGVVEAVMTTSDGTEVRKSQRLRVAPGGVEEARFEFPEAQIDAPVASVLCVPGRADCTRVACDVMNTGDAAGTASFKVTYAMPDQPVLVQRKLVDLAPGQTRTVVGDFEGGRPPGEGRCTEMGDSLTPLVFPKPL